MLEKPDITSEETAEFNSALALLKRINEIEYEIEISLINWNLRDCFSFLESYENELCFAFNDKEKKEVEDAKREYVKLANMYPNFGQTKIDPKGRGYKVNSKEMPLMRRKLIILNQLLRKLKHKYGMGMPSKGESGLF